MIRYWLILGAVALHIPALAARCTVEQSGQDWIIENDVLRLEIDAAAGGRIASWRLKETGEELLVPYKQRREQLSPLLPEQVTSNNGGWKDLAWRKSVPESNLMKLLKKQSGGEALLVLEGDYPGLRLTRRFRVSEGSGVIHLDVTFENAGKAAVSLDYWSHAMLNPEVFLSSDGAGLVEFEADGKTHLVRDKKTEAVAHAGLTRAVVHEGYYFLAPGGGWLARLAPVSHTALLVGLPPSIPAGMLLSVWQSARAASLEMIFPPIVLAPGKSVTFPMVLAAVPAVEKPLAWLGGALVYREGGAIMARALDPSGFGVLGLPGGGDVALNSLAPVRVGAPDTLHEGSAILRHDDRSFRGAFSPDTTELILKTRNPQP